MLTYHCRPHTYSHVQLVNVLLWWHPPFFWWIPLHKLNWPNQNHHSRPHACMPLISCCLLNLFDKIWQLGGFLLSSIDPKFYQNLLKLPQLSTMASVSIIPHLPVSKLLQLLQLLLSHFSSYFLLHHSLLHSVSSSPLRLLPNEPPIPREKIFKLACQWRDSTGHLVPWLQSGHCHWHQSIQNSTLGHHHPWLQQCFEGQCPWHCTMR